MKIKRVLVINEGYSDNLGDQIINDSLQYLLKSHGVKSIDFQDFTKNIKCPIEISVENNLGNKSSVVMHNLKKTIFSMIRIIPAKIRWLIKNTNRVIKTSKNNYDLVIIGGGQLILSNKIFPIAMFWWIFFLRLFGNKNIVLFSVGSGTKFNFIDKLLYKNTLNKVSQIYVRDKKSKEILKNIFNINPKFVYDVAFVYDKIIKRANIVKKNIVVGVIFFGVYNRYNKNRISKEEFFETWIKLLKTNNINLKDINLFYTTKADRVVSLEFKEYISKKYQIELEIIETNTKERLINLLNQSKLVISARMHALILGLTYGCEIITYPVSEKLIEFNNMFNNEFDLKNIQKDINEKLKEILNIK